MISLTHPRRPNYPPTHPPKTKKNSSRGNEVLLPSAKHPEERLKVSQSVSQPGKPSVRQSVRQAGRQTGRQKHTTKLFPVCVWGGGGGGTATK